MNMKKQTALIVLLLLSAGGNYVNADTITYYHVYLNRQKIWESSLLHSGDRVLHVSVSAVNDTLSFQVFGCLYHAESRLLFEFRDTVGNSLFRLEGIGRAEVPISALFLYWRKGIHKINVYLLETEASLRPLLTLVPD